ncbi:MAG TPA: hypothetical protein DEP41_08465 [Rhodobacter sp.]|nr:hypothetical protein [Rhodobacter sp.]
MKMEYRKSDYSLRGHNSIDLSNELVEELRDRFETDRENRFQLFLLSSSIRRKYLDKKTNKYSDEFDIWFKKNKLNELYGSLANFTKYCGCGDVVNYVGTKTSDPQTFLNQLPLSIGSLYELSMVLKSDKDLFEILLYYTPKRKSVDEPKVQWVTKRPPLISKNTTEQKIRVWRNNFDNPPPPKQKRTDKRSLKFLTITVNGELFDFDKKNGDKLGCVDIGDVEELLKRINSLMSEEDHQRFKITNNMDHLYDGYFKRKEATDVTRNIKGGKRDTSQKYV